MITVFFVVVQFYPCIIQEFYVATRGLLCSSSSVCNVSSFFFVIFLDLFRLQDNPMALRMAETLVKFWLL